MVRDPLVLELVGKTPEEPTWGESQIMTVSANMDMESAYLTDGDGNEITDMDMSFSSKKILVTFDKNRTVVCHAQAENGSVAEITLATDKVHTDTTKPAITFTVDGAVTDKQRQVKLTIEDFTDTAFVTKDTDLTLHVEGEVLDFVENVPTKKDKAGVTTVTQNASFIVNKAGSYTVYAYDMAGNFSSKNIEVDLDCEKPVLVNRTAEPTGKANSMELVFTISNEPGTIFAGGKSYTVKNAGDDVRVIVRKNGTYPVIATDKAGNETKTEVTISHLDDTKPVITAANNGKYSFSYREISTEEKLTEAILKNITATDDSGEEVTLSVEYTLDVDFSKNGQYVAIVTAEDAYSNVAEKYVQFSMIYNEVIQHKELESFGVNGEILVENSIITTDSTTLSFVNVPENAVISYAQGKNTGAQIKMYPIKWTHNN